MTVAKKTGDAGHATWLSKHPPSQAPHTGTEPGLGLTGTTSVMPVCPYYSTLQE